MNSIQVLARDPEQSIRGERRGEKARSTSPALTSLFGGNGPCRFFSTSNHTSVDKVLSSFSGLGHNLSQICSILDSSNETRHLVSQHGWEQLYPSIKLVCVIAAVKQIHDFGAVIQKLQASRSRLENYLLVH